MRQRPLANPLTSDEFGDFYFNGTNGHKRLEYHFGGQLRWKEQIIVGPLPLQSRLHRHPIPQHRLPGTGQGRRHGSGRVDACSV
jgi:hypothetical protein